VSGAGAREVDRGQLRALLVAYLRLSLRARGALFGRAAESRRRGFWMMGLGYLALGAVMGVVALDHPDVFTFAVLIHTGTLFMTLSVIGIVAGDVLFGAAEPDVLAFRPVSPATLLLAKSLNLAAVAVGVALLFNLFPMVLGLACRGARPWFPVVHALSSVLLALFAAAAQVFLYALLARRFARERLERAAAWAQVAASAAIALLSQILPRMAEGVGGLHLARSLAWLAPLPMAWFAALDAALGGARAEPRMLALAVGGCALTALAGWAAVRRLSPGLGEAMSAPREAVTLRHRPRRRWGAAALDPLLDAWLPDPVERGTFRVTAVYLRRDHEVLTRLYPLVAPIAALLLIAGLQRAELRPLYLAMTSFFFVTIPVTAVETLEVSSQYAAAELFRVAPLGDTAALFHGVRKAVFALLTLPAAGALALLVAGVARGDPAALLPSLPILLLLPVVDLLPALRAGYVPFALDPQRGLQATRSTGVLFAALAIAAPVIAAGVWARRLGVFPAMLAVEAVVVVVTRFLLLRRIREVSRVEPLE
jgi:hypothetical protein